MDRRHFIKSAGISFGSILLIPATAEPSQLSPGGGTITSPDEVVAFSGDTPTSLISSDGRTWRAKEMQVRLSDTRRGLAIDISSPAEDLRSVVLRWNVRRPASLKCLGDQWERSYGDLQWAGVNSDRIMPWYFLEYDGKVTNGFGVGTGCGAMCFWQAGTESLLLTLDLKSGGGGVALGERVLRAAEIIVRKGKEDESPFAATKELCKLLCPAPLLPKEPVYGINDWYFTYGDNSEELILQHARLMAEFAPQNSNSPFCMIDAGWAKYSPLRPGDNCWGDLFSESNAKFSNMSQLAAKIKALGMRPAIWVRPLCARSDDNAGTILPLIPGRNNPTCPVLDPTIPENLERVQNYFRLYKEWGYELIKHDFTTFDIFGKWGFQMIQSGAMTADNWHFRSRTSTNAEILTLMYRAIREAAGDTPLIGCNTISHLSAGLVELQRIGDDTSGREWDRTRVMGVNTLGFRIPQHATFYAVDADCVGLTTKVPWEKNRQWMQLLAESGTPLFISAQKEAVGEAQRESIRRSFRIASQPRETGRPLDWLDRQAPSRWWLLGREVEFDWS